jgi:hypothetical protein
MMSDVRFAVGDADAGLAERLDKEISAFNAAVTGHHDGRMLSVAVRGEPGSWPPLKPRSDAAAATGWP